MSTRTTNLKRLAAGAAAASLLAFGGVAYAQQQEGQAPNGQPRQEQQAPGDREDCPWKDGSGQQEQDAQTEV